MASSNTVPLQCLVCKKTFSGVVPAQQHFASAVHKKKEENARDAQNGVETGYFCEICNISCNTSIMLQIHKDSPRHQAQVEKQRLLQGGPPGVVGQSTYSTPERGTIGGSNYEQSSVDQEYTFSSTTQKGYCYLCRLDLTSKAHATSHLSGKKHKSRSEQFERNLEQQEREENWFVDPVHINISLKPRTQDTKTTAAMATAFTRHSCSICTLMFNSQPTMDAHLASEKHRRKAETVAERLGQMHPFLCYLCGVGFNNKAEQSDHLENSIHHLQMKNAFDRIEQADGRPVLRCDPCGVTFFSLLRRDEHLKSQSHTNMVQAQVGSYGQLLQANPTSSPHTASQPLLPEGAFYCKVCNVTLNGPKPKADHMESEKHKKKEFLALQDEETTQSSSLYCEVCDVSFTGVENRNDHLAGRKHQRNVQNMNIQKASGQNTSSSDVQLLQFSRKQDNPDTFSTQMHRPQAQYAGSYMDPTQGLFSASKQSTNNPNLLSHYEGSKFINKLTHDDNDDENDENDDINAKPFSNERQVLLNNDSGLQVQLSNAREDFVEGQFSSNQDETKILAETHVDADSMSEYLSNLDIKSQFTDNTETDRCSSRLTEPYRRVFNELRSSTPLPLGRGRGLFSLTGYYPGKVVNTEASLERSGNSPEGYPKPDQSNYEEAMLNEETGRKELITHSQDGIEMSKWEPTSRLQSQDSQGFKTANMQGVWHNTQEKQQNDDSEIRSESGDSLAQEGIRFDSLLSHMPAKETVLPRPVSDGDPATKPTWNNSMPDFCFDPVKGTGRCFICEVDFNSETHKNQHLSGKKHHRTKAVLSMVVRSNLTDKNSLFCSVCTVTFSCQAAKEEHLASEKHLLKLKKKQGLTDTQTYFCDACKVPCSSQGNYEQHLQGAQHRKATGIANVSPTISNTSSPEGQGAQLSPIVLPGTDRTQWYSCNICHCKMNSYEQMQIHMQSPKHLAKLSQASDSSPVAGGFDRTHWFPCHICHCKMNTLEQLRTHEQSPKHLKQVQKMGGNPAISNLNLQMPTDGNAVQSEYPTEDTGSFLEANSGNQTPLDSFLSQPLFPEEYLPYDVKVAQQENNNQATGSSSAKPASPLQLQETDDPFVMQERYGQVRPNGSDCHGDQGQGHSDSKDKGQMSDLAYATRAKSATASGNGNVSPEQATPFGKTALSDVCKFISTKDTVNQLNQSQDGLSPTANNPYAATHKFFCHTCKSPMNTQESYENHCKGKRHQANVCTEPAPERRHGLPLEIPADFVPHTVTTPRNYQFELYSKAMQEDSLVFLPTGTGKTLVSVMTMSAYLEKYRTKSILFLVDKVLLVFQQSKYISEQLRDKEFHRFNTESEDCLELVYRPLRIAAMCMGQQSTGGIPLWKHDIVIATAGFCKNLLDKKVLHWHDFGLVVFDEAHHCEKGHPFNTLLNNYHLQLEEDRPRVLGLTASPAGKADVPKTIQMLQTLMDNMGGALMRINENQECIETLAQFQSNATMIIKAITDESEGKDLFQKTFEKELNVYIMFCVLRLLEISNIRNYLELRSQIKPGMQESLVRLVADEFVESQIDLIQSSLRMLENTVLDARNQKVDFSYFTCHVADVCMARGSLLDGGITCAFQDLEEMNRTPNSFEYARVTFGMQTESLETLLERNRAQFVCQSPTSVESQVLPADHHVRHLIEELTSSGHARGSKRISLVLVKQRSTAFHLTSILQNSEQMLRMGLSTATVVGHGGSGETGGMNVRQQKRVLDEIKEYKYQVIIATSVAEEGVDWPECERVISMYPPSTVTALIQMRGRARQKDSKFVVLCGSMDEENKLRDIMHREQNMITATHIIVRGVAP